MFNIEEDDMGTTRKWAQGRRLRALITTLGLAVLAALLLAGNAFAAPGRPTAKTPNATSTVITTTPTFKWSRAARTATYEVRVYKGSALQVKKTGITRLSWKCSKVLTKGVTYTWKVRGRKAGVNGAWSRSRKFTVANSDKAITAFSFTSPAASGVVNETLHTIAVTVPFGTNVTALVATFTTSGATITVGGALQTSGTTANNFSSPVTYTVAAADATTQAYTVTVTVTAPVIGQSYGGGKIAYILQAGDPGYVAGQTHGLIAATADQSPGIRWAPALQNTLVPGGTGTAIGTGSANTTKIATQQGTTLSTNAAGLCYNLYTGGYSDWYLPSMNELNKLYLNRVAIGGFQSAVYWSSSEFVNFAAWYQWFVDGGQSVGNKSSLFVVRAIRSF